MEVLLNKIFLESNRMRFGDMHNAITDYMDDNAVEYTKYLAPADNEGSEVSMFVLGIFALLRTLKNHSNQSEQRKIVKQYIDELCNVIDTTNFMNEQYDLPDLDGIVDSIKSFFGSNDDPAKKDDRVLDKHQLITNRFNDLLKIMTEMLPSSYSDLCVLQLTIPVLVFENTFENSNILDEYIINLKELVIDTDEHNVYDEPNYRGYIEF
jgi:hypothetical protein